MTVILREVSAADAPHVVALWLDVFGAFREQLYDWDVFQQALQNTVLPDTDMQYLVAEVDGQIAGVVGYVAPEQEKDAMFPPQSAVIRLLAVAAKHRGLGIGNCLVQKCIALANRDGARYLALHTTAYFTAAIELYQRLGFQSRGECRQAGSGAPCLLMVLDL